MAGEYVSEREAVLAAVRRIVDEGLVAGASGNVSCRAGSGLYAITASRVPYHRFGLADVLVVDDEVEPVVGTGVPSSESLTHLAVYQARPDVGAVIHTHSPYASAFAVAGEPIAPVLDEQVVAIGGAVLVAEYAPSASEELARNAVAALAERAAVLLRNHGAVIATADLDEAVAVAVLLERVAKVCILSRIIGRTGELPADVVAAEAAAYRMMKGLRET